MWKCILFGLLLMPFLMSTGFPEDMGLAEVRESSAGPLPLVTYPFFVDACSGFIGTITDDKKLFQLWSEDGHLVFERMAEADSWGYLYVQMRDTPGLILLAESMSESVLGVNVLDYSGVLLSGPLELRNIVAVSPSGQYLYSLNDPAFAAAEPCMYDRRTGVELAEFDHAGLSWDIRVISDSVILYRDRDRVQLISVPDMLMISEMTADAAPHIEDQSSALSQDGLWYAYSKMANVVVCDLRGGSSYSIPLELIDSLYYQPHLSISNNGLYLATMARTSRGHEVSVYKKMAEAYLKVAEDIDIAPGKSLYLWPGAGGQFLDGSICSLSLFHAGSSGVRFYSYVLDAAASKADLNGMFVEGLLALEPPASDGSVRVRTTKLEARMATVKIFKLIGGEQ